MKYLKYFENSLWSELYDYDQFTFNKAPLIITENDTQRVSNILLKLGISYHASLVEEWDVDSLCYFIKIEDGIYNRICSIFFYSDDWFIVTSNIEKYIVEYAVDGWDGLEDIMDKKLR